MGYNRIEMNKEIDIKKIVTFHYYEFAKDFVFTGERHDFWEFLYVDEGEVEITAEDEKYRLSQGDIIFHKPNEFHGILAINETASNVVVFCFECNSLSMSFFENKICHLSDDERNFLSIVVKEGYNTFSGFNYSLGDPNICKLDKRNPPIIGSEQFIINYLEIFLLTIIRNHMVAEYYSGLSSTVKANFDNEILDRVIEHMRNNLSENLSLSDFCNHVNICKSNLSALFKKYLGTSVTKYYRKIKIDQAKILIRSGKYTFTQISRMLGYNSVQYFSRHYKNETGFSPTEYAKSIEARVDPDVDPHENT